MSLSFSVFPFSSFFFVQRGAFVRIPIQSLCARAIQRFILNASHSYHINQPTDELYKVKAWMGLRRSDLLHKTNAQTCIQERAFEVAPWPPTPVTFSRVLPCSAMIFLRSIGFCMLLHMHYYVITHALLWAFSVWMCWNLSKKKSITYNKLDCNFFLDI